MLIIIYDYFLIVFIFLWSFKSLLTH